MLSAPPAVEDVPEEGLDVPLRLEKLANTVTHQRLKAALGALSGDSGARGPAAPLVDAMFGRREPKFAAQPPAWVPLNTGAAAAAAASQAWLLCKPF